MVHGPKWQNSNKIIAGKPADATRANAIPINVGSKKSGGFFNRVSSVAQPRRRKTSSQPSSQPQPQPQPSCEFFFIKKNSTGNFLDTRLSLLALTLFNVSFFDQGPAGVTSPFNEYKVKLVSTGKSNGSKYIVNREGKYMTVLVISAAYSVTFEDKDNLYDYQEFIVTGTIGSINATIQIPTGSSTGGDYRYLTESSYTGQVLFQPAPPGGNVHEDDRLSFLSASSNGC